MTPIELRERKDVQQLIAVGKAKGFVTLDDVGRHLPSDFLSRDRIEHVFRLLPLLNLCLCLLKTRLNHLDIGWRNQNRNRFERGLFQ